MGEGLELEGVSKRFGALQAVRNVSIAVKPGEVFGFVGSNGAGKTTTMRIILGVVAADAGQVTWNGVPIDFDSRRRIGYMPEERGLYPKMRIGEQIAYFGQLHGLAGADAQRSTLSWLERFGLADRSRDELQKLSHGNQQRVQLAAALVFEPELLILDEPFAGLDPEAVDAMSEVLHERAASGVPVVFSSHQLELVERLSDRVGIIRSGELIASGTVDELRAGGPDRVWLDVPTAPAAWSPATSGAKLVRRDGTRLLVELAAGADDQALLQEALQTGPVGEFRRDKPTLLDLFREYVSEAGDRAA